MVTIYMGMTEGVRGEDRSGGSGQKLKRALPKGGTQV